MHYVEPASYLINFTCLPLLLKLFCAYNISDWIVWTVRCPSDKKCLAAEQH